MRVGTGSYSTLCVVYSFSQELVLKTMAKPRSGSSWLQWVQSLVLSLAAAQQGSLRLGWWDGGAYPHRVFMRNQMEQCKRKVLSNSGAF